MTEFYDIPGYVGLYKISRDGRVFSTRWNRLLKHGIGEGYPKVTLYRDQRGRSHSIHRMLAQMFIPNPDNLPIVNHRDGNKLNFSLENLEWCSFEDNSAHAVKMGLVTAWNKGHKASHLKKNCEECHRSYDAHRRRQRFCSAKCSAKWRVRERPELIQRARDSRGQFQTIELFKQGVLTRDAA